MPLRTLQRWESEPDAQPEAKLYIDLLDALGVPREDGFRALGWLHDDEGIPPRVLQLMAEMPDDELEQFMPELFEYLARRQRNSR